jgi:arginine deiminase
LAAQNADNIIDFGGTGSDNMSIWAVTHGSNQTRIIYPEGTAAGITRKDKGEQRVTDDLGNAYYGKEEEFRQYIGVSVGDWRWNARVANIDVSDLISGTTDPYKFLRQLYWQLQGRRNGKVQNGGMLTAGRTVIYANRTFLQALDAKTTTADKVQLTPDEVAGTEILTYRGIPLRETDALINAESVVS